MTDIVLSNVTKCFGKTIAVDDVSLEIYRGELLVLVGPSGCGKTTLLRLIAGLEQPEAGSIRLGDRIVDGVPARERQVAMVFQKHALYPHLTVQQNLAFGLKMRRVARSEIDVRVQSAAKTLRIQDLLGRKPAELSGGQQQRVALGRAMVQRPQVFLLDEPLSSLDGSLREAMRKELLRLQQQLKTTMVHVTHDESEARQMGHRIAVMREGRISKLGTPDEVFG